ncbi:DUF3375 family protein [Nitrococcus mobilis]|uniref:Uncharacterized protein n=1 Tax=Nitrococcus mobilis Nb-231 TaxID=314278 RepID=A4BRJ9_9GAMM|nr:DUF3375 family protein [Nitrococcus mobilis]EAR21570.1 hypothetical protein NB231_02348 [Nitrococcus mobilis Nb-231]
MALQQCAAWAACAIMAARLTCTVETLMDSLTRTMDHDYLQTLRRLHPAWRLLAADHGPLVIGFLHRCFIEPNVRTLSEEEAAARLEDYLFQLRERFGEEAFPKRALDYLNDWANDQRGWLRKYYRETRDEPCFDITPATEQAIQWLAGLEQQQFVGTESRLLTVFDLLRQIVQGTETDPETRIADLLAEHPLQQGLAELVVYLSLAAADRKAVIDEQTPQSVAWTDETGRIRRARLPAVVYTR